MGNHKSFDEHTFIPTHVGFDEYNMIFIVRYICSDEECEGQYLDTVKCEEV